MANTIAQKSNTMLQKLKNTYLVPFIFLFPSLILFFTFFYLPTFAAFFYSLMDYQLLQDPKWIGLDNYKQLMNDSLFWKALGNSAMYVVIIVPALVVIPLLIAILVNQKLRGISLFRLIIFLPVVTPMIAVAIVWEFIYHPMGLLNGILQTVGINIDENWLLNADLALPAIAILQIWKFVGYFMMIYLAGLQAVSRDLIEAARLDGASSFRVLWHVYIPQLRPIIAVVLILSTMEAVRVFTSVYVMTGGGPLDSTISLPVYVYRKAFVELDMGYASTIGIVLWLILVVMTILNFKISRGSEN